MTGEETPATDGRGPLYWLAAIILAGIILIFGLPILGTVFAFGCAAMGG